MLGCHGTGRHLPALQTETAHASTDSTRAGTGTLGTAHAAATRTRHSKGGTPMGGRQERNLGGTGTQRGKGYCGRNGERERTEPTAGAQHL